MPLTEVRMIEKDLFIVKTLMEFINVIWKLLWVNYTETAFRSVGMVELPEKIPKGKRTSYKLLLKDHYLMVQLFKMTDSTFCVILNFYYFLEVSFII